MTFPISSILENEDDTKKIATEFASGLVEGDVIALKGNLGSGKTFFVKSVCKSYGILNVSSPSFAIVNIYEGDYKINHFDFYRIKKINELYDIGFIEYLNEDSITFIEWAEMFPKILPRTYYLVEIEFISETIRKIIISKHE